MRISNTTEEYIPAYRSNVLLHLAVSIKSLDPTITYSRLLLHGVQLQASFQELNASHIPGTSFIFYVSLKAQEELDLKRIKVTHVTAIHVTYFRRAHFSSCLQLAFARAIERQ
jgi:hypothetical protein